MITKNKTKPSPIQLICIVLVGLALTACSPSDNAGVQAKSGASDPSMLLFLDQVPAGALSVAEARVQLSPGDEATVQGQIGGAVEPFLSGYAGFILTDTEVLFCDEMSEDDHCKTPWDACCEDIDKLNASRISVQFVDAEGNPLEGDLQASTDLKGLDHVVVVGTVSETSTKQNMIVLAEKLALQK